MVNHQATFTACMGLFAVVLGGSASISSAFSTFRGSSQRHVPQQQYRILSSSSLMASTDSNTVVEKEPITADPLPDGSIRAVQDERVDAPASIVFYDEVLDDALPEGVVCARGVCVLAEDFGEDFNIADGDDTMDKNLADMVLNSYLGPRALLAAASILYGTNFPLGAIMNDNLPPSAATAARFVLASVALSPFVFKLSPKLTWLALLCGCSTALGYITQSLALVDVSPATVAFLGAATVVVCPTLPRSPCTDSP